ncbi:DUF4347 domain-containing protein [Ramlibacter tataouinensis]|uniref:DUF4347 domain-containing protein n=1 Tax=Ramlibacter tataouinensis TaxID=94132 RepID=UPI0022F3C7CE|nr:DUF4347 domain-containing protein [Ramlibacter tataouinensis]WBY03784.1 DUF4347 domain-containing protein [Ramlibacter tataouinensis]
MSKKVPTKRRSRLLALEPRVLFDGALVDTAAALPGALDAVQAVQAADAASRAYPAAELSPELAALAQLALDAPIAAATPTSVEWLIIDGRVPDAAALAAQARPGLQVLLLDPAADGLAQIRQALAADGRPADALHIVSHGAPGFIRLGSTNLDAAQLEGRATDLAAIGARLTASGDLLLYGCDVAAGAAGEDYVDRLGQLTGADVAASRDATGGAARNGNWLFEYTAGPVTATPFLSDADGRNYQALLPTINLAGNAGWTPLLYGSRQDPAGDMQSAASSTDLVGDLYHPTLFYAYDDGGTATEADDSIIFRFRVSGPNSQGRFGAYGIIGIDADLNGDIDLFLIADDSQGATVGLYNPGTDLNNSPSTTSYTAAPGRQYTLDASNYAFTPVSPASEPPATGVGNADIDGGGKSDYFVSFRLSFAEIKAELARANVAGNPAAGIAVDRFSPMRFILATATQTNSLNGDIGGVVGANKSTLTWDQLGAFSPVINASNSPPIITSDGGGQTAFVQVGEGESVITTVAATDLNPGDTVRYFISGGADAAKFVIDPVTGVLSFAPGFTPSVTAPTDADGDGRYQVTVSARDYSDPGATEWKRGEDTQNLTITVLRQPDTTAPTLDLRTGITPADNATNIAPNANLFMRFSEAVQPGTGYIYIRNATTGAIVRQISVNDADQVRFSGNTVTINPVFDLPAGTAYYVELDAAAFQDTAGNTYVALDAAGNPILVAGQPAGVNDTDPNTTYRWNFSVGSNSLNDGTPPTLVATAVTGSSGATLSPADNQVNVRETTDIVLTFSEAVFPDNGFFILRRSADGAIVARINSADPTQVSFSADGRTVTINPASDLAQNTDYYLQVEGAALQDASGNRYAGFTDLNQGISNAYRLNFKTGVDVTAPTVTLVSAANLDGTWIEGDTIFVRVKFTEQVYVTGVPQIQLAAGNLRTASYVSGSGSDTLIFSYSIQAGDTTADLNYVATNSLGLNGGTIKDAAGNVANLTLPATGAANSLGGQKDLAIDMAPVNTLPALLVARNNSPLAIAASVADADSGNLTVKLTATHGTLSLGTIAGLVFTGGDGSADASMTFSGTQAQINAALATLSYQADAGYVGVASVTLETTDGVTSMNGVVVRDVDTLTLDVQGPVPVLAGTGAIAYVENDPATAVAPVLSLTGVANVSGATVRITGNYQPGEDVLAFIDQNGISGSWDAATGTLTLTGLASVADYQAALRSVTYRNISETPSPAARTVTFIAANGGDNSDPATVTVSVTPVDDAPTLTLTAGNPTFTEGGAAVALFGNATVSTIEAGQTLSRLTLTVANVRNGAFEVLTIDGQAIGLAAGSTTVGGVTYTVGVSGTTATVTVSGLALNAADAKALIEGITYHNASAAPNAGNRTVTVSQLQDSGSSTGPHRNTATLALASTVRVVTTNAVPVLGGGSPGVSYVENGAGAAVHPALTVADEDNTTLQGARIAITGGFVAGQDLLAFTNQSGIVGSYDAATGVLTLSGTASVAAYQAALRSVTYRNSSDAPGTAVRTIGITVNDGAGDSDPATSTVTVVAVNDAPAGADRTLTVLQGNSYAFGVADFGFRDSADAGAHGLHSVVITTLPAAGTLTLNGVVLAAGASATLAQISAGQLLYTPAGTTSSSFTFQVRDDGGTANGGVDLDPTPNTLTLSVSTVNVAPLLAGTPAASYTENGAPVALNGVLTITDPDSSNMTGAIVRITTGFVAGQDVLSFTNQNGISGVYNAATGVLSLSGSASQAQWQAALRSITYHNTSEDPATAARTVRWSVSDGVEFSAGIDSTLTVAAVNDAPVLSGPPSSVSYAEGAAARAVNPWLFVADVDNTTLATASVSITANRHANDRLLFTNDGSTMGNIAGSYDSVTGVLSLSSAGGTATLAQWQAALRAVAFDSTGSPGTATRTIAFRVNDGSADSNVLANSSVTTVPGNTAPVLGGGNTWTYTENQADTAVDAGLTLADNGTTVAGAVVRIQGYVAGQDVLGFANQNGISGVFNSATGVLTLTGTTTLANYQAALRSITYVNSSEAPTGGARTVSFVVDDGGSVSNLSNEVVTTITVVPVNDAPSTASETVHVASGPSANYVFSLAEFAFSDVDSGMAGIVITTQIASGGAIRLGANALSNGAFVTVDQIRSGLLNYQSANGNTADRTFTFQVRDDAGADSPAATMTLKVGAAGAKPTLGGALTNKTYTENALGLALVDAGVTLSNATYTTAKVAISGNFVPGEDVLSFTYNAGTMGPNVITAAYSGGVLTLTSAGSTQAQMAAALKAVLYTNSSDNPSSAARTFSVSTRTSVATDNWSTAYSATLGVTPVNDAPVLSSAGSSLSYSPGAPAAINPWLHVSDVDNLNLQSATVTLANPQAGDSLAFISNAATMGNIAGSYNSGTGILTLSSAGNTATLAQWQAALRAVTFHNASGGNSTPRTVNFVVSDGAANSGAVTTTIAIGGSGSTAAPVLAGSATLAYIENGAAAAINGVLTLSDADSANLTGATVRITNFVAGQDVLSFTDQNGISGLFDSATGVLTLSGSSSVANYQAALRSVRYANSSDHPSTAARSVVYQVSDGATFSGLSNQLASTVTVTAVNDAPTLSSPSPLTYNDDRFPQSFFAATGILTVSDLDGAGALYGITGDSAAGAGAPAGMDRQKIGTYGTLYLNSATGAYSFVPDSAAINAVQAGQTPSESFTFTVSDLSGGSDTRTLTVNIVGANDSPILASASTEVSYTEDGAATPVNTVITVSDADNATLVSATISISGNYRSGQDLLAFTNAGAAVHGNISASFDAGTGTLTLTSAGGTATLAQWQAALRAVTYANTSQAPDTALRTVSFQVNDGGGNGASNTIASSSVSVVSVNDAPVLANGGTAAYTEQDPAVAISPALSLSDADHTSLQSATVWIQNFVAGQDVLGFTDQNGISGSWDAVSGVLTLSGTASVAHYQAALRSITYANASEDPVGTPRIVRYQVGDGTDTSNIVSATVTVTAVNDLPTLGGGGDTLGYIENGPAAPIAPSLTVADVDSEGLASATVRISAGHVAGEDLLSFANDGTMGNISASFDAATGVLTLVSSGASATAQEWQAALRAVAYRNSSDAPTAAARTISYQIDDGAGLSNTVTATVTVLPVNDAPVLGGVATSVNFTENGAPVVVNSAITVADPDHLQLSGATVSIGAGFAAGQDLLGFIDQNGITGSYDAATGVLTLSGAASLAHYQAALRSVTYANSSDSPSTAARTIRFQVSDGADASNTWTSTVGVTALNDAPVLVPVGHDLTVAEDAGAPAGGAVGVDIAALVGGQSDADAGALAGIAVTALDSSQGRWYYTIDGGASWAEVAGAPSASSALLLAADGATRLYFRPGADFNGNLAAAVTFRAWDRTAGSNGGRFDASVNGGSSAFSSATDVIDVSVAPVNDAPVGTDNVLWVDKNGSRLLATADFGFSDPGDAAKPDSLLAVQISTLPDAGAGLLEWRNGVGTWVAVSAGDTISAADIAAGKLRFTAAANQTGMGLGNLRFRVQDDGGTAGGGIDTDTSERAIVFNVGSQSAPVLSGGNDLAYAEQTPPVAQVVNPNITVHDDDNPQLESGMVVMSRGFVSGQDELAFSNTSAALYGDITAAWDAVNGVLSFSSAAGATQAQWQAAFRAVTYRNLSDAPGTAERSVSFIVNDGTQDSNVVSATITMDRENDAPTLTASGGSLAYVENQAATAIDAGLVIADPDLPSNFGGGWLQVAFASGGAAEDRLTVLHAGSGPGQIGVVGTTITYEGIVIGSIDAALGGVGGQPLRIHLTTGASVAATQALARAIAYSNVSDAPSTGGRTVVFTLDDGGNTGTGGPLQGSSAAVAITVAAVNDAPSGADGALSIKQGTSHVFGASEFGFVDALDGHGFAGILVASLPAGGTLERWDGASWVAVGAGEFISAADIGGGNFRFLANPVPGSSAFSFQVRDSGGTANGGADTDPVARTMAVAVTAGDPPVLAGAANVVYVEDDGAVPILGSVVVTDPDSGQLQQATLTLTGYVPGEDLLTFTGSAGITGSFAGGTLTLNGVATLADWQAVLRSVQYQNTSNAPSTATRTLSVVLKDNEGTPNSSSTVHLAITVAARNDAPMLAATPGLTLDSVLEDADAPSGVVGTSVADLVGGQSDVDGAAALKGIAVTQLGGAGSWYYTTDGGLSWTQVGAAPSDAAALLLAADGATRLYYRPAANANGTIANALTFRAWDRSSGSNGGTADTSGALNGGTTAFSADTDVAAITVTSVADAPVGTDKTLTLLINTSHVFGAGDFGFSDPGDSPADDFAAVLITSVPAGGTLVLDGVAIGSATLGSPVVVSVADLAAGKLVYTAASSAGSPSFRFLVQDDGGTAFGGADTDTAERTLTLATYDTYPPVLAGGSTLTFTEGQGPQVVNGVLVLSDSDSANAAGAVVRIAAGYVPGQDVLAFTAPMGSGITGSFNAATGELTLSGSASLAHYQAALRSVTYANGSDDPSSTSRTIRFTVTDTGGKTSAALDSTVTVTPVNDAPTLTVGGSGGTFTEGAGSSQGTAVSLFTGAVVSTIESAQNLVGLTLTAAGLQDGGAETLIIDGTQVSLGANGTGTTATNGLTYTVTLGGAGAATIVLVKPAGVAPSVMSALVNGLQYQNTHIDAPTGGNRTFTVTQLQDSGGWGMGGWIRQGWGLRPR